MKLRIAKTSSEGLDMTPMIDIIFQLIIFFMVASSFVEQAKVYKVEVPKADAPQTISTEEARKITITKEGIVAPGGITSEDERYESLLDLVEDLKMMLRGQEVRAPPASDPWSTSVPAE